MTSTPELITITPETSGGLVTIELTTRPRPLTTTLANIGLERLPDIATPSPPPAKSASDGSARHEVAPDEGVAAGRSRLRRLR